MHFHPRYCPDRNRIERAWQDLHASVTASCSGGRGLLASAHDYRLGYPWRRAVWAAALLDALKMFEPLIADLAL